MHDDIKIMRAAFERVKELELVYEDSIPWKAIQEGFSYSGEKVLLANQVQGIFKPKVISRGPISIKTTLPKGDRENIYNDHLTDSGFYQYSLEAGDPRGERNVLLWQALEDKTPFIYFHAIAPAIYKALWPCFVRSILPEKGYAEIAVGSIEYDAKPDKIYEMPSEVESKYHVRETKVRLHQASFREMVLNAYQHKCAITQLPIVILLEAAHIIPDSQVGEIQMVSNGISLSRLHHRAYDSNLIGIDSEYRIHISQELSVENGGPLLEQGIQNYSGTKITVPLQHNLKPNRDYLARRFEAFQIKNR